MGSFVASVDIPMSERNRICFCALRGESQQRLQTILWIDVRVISAVRPQFSKKRIFAGAGTGALSHDRDADPRNFWLSRRHCIRQPIEVIRGGSAKRVLLVRCPKMRGKLFDKLRGLIYPIESFERGIQLNLRKFAEPLGPLLRGKSREIRKFSIQGNAFRGKLVVVLDDFAEKARQKT